MDWLIDLSTSIRLTSDIELEVYLKLKIDSS